MTINVNVVIDLSENTVNLLSALLGYTAKTQVQETTTAPVVTLPATETEVKKEKAAKPAKAAAATVAPAASANGTASTLAAEEETARLQIREKTVQLRDKGLKDKTVALMQKYGLTQLSKLPADQLTAYWNELNAIA